MTKSSTESSPPSSSVPSPTQFLPFALPDIGDEEIASVVETLRSGWLTTGPKAKQFEREFAGFLGVADGVAVNSATAALHLALDAIGLKEGDEVIVPTMTFAATGEVVQYLKAKPVLVDSEDDTLNMSPEAFERAITPRTRAVIPVHFAGHACDMDPILDIARRHEIRVIEDAAHAFPAHYRGRIIGTLGDITCFSFYATKTITTGEGGMLVSNNVEIIDRARIMSLHGISRDAWKRYTAEGSWYYEILYPGYKYNLTDIAAAIGIEQLKKAQRFLDARRRIAQRYDESFSDLPEVRLPVVREGVDHAWHLYVVRLQLDRLRINRNDFIDQLKTRNIGTSVHFIPLHLHPHYRGGWGYQPTDFPVANAAYEEVVSLPIYTRMSDEDVQTVIDAVRDVILRYRR
jgi:dTDP-4-amino-4,6-dideoxygalactose transaminase